ncbi:T3SS regulon translocated regulator ExsE family protein [Photorhabdus antumapuensis]|uniref:T3SS regulon translocated regulator ExsE family protein n=1 Tax=Photorhabdus antumapuensis TaxID=2862867 RepID=UPI001CEC6156|nr:T3SS regulon translocated regulator ExsE family protein [Photorhabdus antumapuensis]MCA6219638.1 T3SS regulon translocated regulator ExsE family protein [Photorhabdus antumapuensis]
MKIENSLPIHLTNVPHENDSLCCGRRITSGYIPQNVHEPLSAVLSRGLVMGLEHETTLQRLLDGQHTPLSQRKISLT